METLVLIQRDELKTLIIDSVNACLKYNRTAIDPPKEEAQLINIKEAAILIKYSVPSIYRLINKKEIPSLKKRGKILFNKEELLAWAQEGRRKTKYEINEDAEKHLGELGQKKAYDSKPIVKKVVSF